MEQIKAPGLKWVKRKDGRAVPYWCASHDAVKAGFVPKTLNLAHEPPEHLEDCCERVQAEMLAFLGKPRGPVYDGTVTSLIDLYEAHPSSKFQRLKPATASIYSGILARLRKAYGGIKIRKLTGLDVMAWHADWRHSPDGGPDRIPIASMTLSIFKSALTFGQLCGFEDCMKVRAMLGVLNLPKPAPRQEAPDASVVQRAIAAAVELGHPCAALGYAIQFETATRQWDMIGQWVPLSDARWSDIFRACKKWIGPTWLNIDQNMIFSYTPSKTEHTTGRRVFVDLKLCPMVMEAISRIPPEQRRGPLVMNSATGRPFSGTSYIVLWRHVRKKAGLPSSLWNRDLRAGGITEGGMAGASADDRGKMAGHSGAKMTRQVYDRDVLIGANRVAVARAKFREKKG